MRNIRRGFSLIESKLLRDNNNVTKNLPLNGVIFPVVQGGTALGPICKNVLLSFKRSSTHILDFQERNPPFQHKSNPIIL
jgi:hypothetical protein